MPAETVLTLAGIGMIAIAWFLIQYLKQPRNGYSSLKPDSIAHDANLESLIVIESFTNKSSADDSQLFRGGSGGGGGASGEY